MPAVAVILRLRVGRRASLPQGDELLRRFAPAEVATGLDRAEGERLCAAGLERERHVLAMLEGVRLSTRDDGDCRVAGDLICPLLDALEVRAVVAERLHPPLRQVVGHVPGRDPVAFGEDFAALQFVRGEIAPDKIEVALPNPLTAGVAKLADARDSKSRLCDSCPFRNSSKEIEPEGDPPKSE